MKVKHTSGELPAIGDRSVLCQWPKCARSVTSVFLSVNKVCPASSPSVPCHFKMTHWRNCQELSNCILPALYSLCVCSHRTKPQTQCSEEVLWTLISILLNQIITEVFVSWLCTLWQDLYGVHPFMFFNNGRAQTNTGHVETCIVEFEQEWWVCFQFCIIAACFSCLSGVEIWNFIKSYKQICFFHQSIFD